MRPAAPPDSHRGQEVALRAGARTSRRARHRRARHGTAATVAGAARPHSRRANGATLGLPPPGAATADRLGAELTNMDRALEIAVPKGHADALKTTAGFDQLLADLHRASANLLAPRKVGRMAGMRPSDAAGWPGDERGRRVLPDPERGPQPRSTSTRHAIAAERGEEYPDDTLRPLTRRAPPAMRRAVAGPAIARPLDRSRAHEPARACEADGGIGGRAACRRPRDGCARALAPGHAPAEVAHALRRFTARRTIALVGHEPDLGALAAWLIGARAPFAFRKGGIARFDIDPDSRRTRTDSCTAAARDARGPTRRGYG